jgi:CheY-like chemotaxis protein
MRVLIADDDRAFAEYLSAMVELCGHEVVATVTGGGLAAIQSYTRHRPDVMLLDVLMPRFNGFTVCQQLVSRDPAARVILMSGLVASDYPSLATSPACGYLSKPVGLAELRSALDKASMRQEPDFHQPLRSLPRVAAA